MISSFFPFLTFSWSIEVISIPTKNSHAFQILIIYVSIFIIMFFNAFLYHESKATSKLNYCFNLIDDQYRMKNCEF